MIDNLKCRMVSLADYILGRDEEYMVLDEEKNMYIKGRKFKAQKIGNHEFKESDGWFLELDMNGVKFYRKR